MSNKVIDPTETDSSLVDSDAGYTYFKTTENSNIII